MEHVLSGVRGELLDFSDMYEREFDCVYRAAWLLARDGDVAADATQEAFARAWSRWWRLRDKPWLRGWLIRTASNEVRDRLRTRRDTPTEERHVPPPPEDLLDLRRALAELPLRRREAMVLYYVGDLPITAIAELMHTSEGTVKAHLSQGRDALRAALREGDD